MSGIGKNIIHVHLDRLSRFFVGTQSPDHPKDAWQEMGHFTQGLSFRLMSVIQKNGMLQHTGEMLGWKVEGTFEPGQNTIVDYRFYHTMMRGIRNIAFLSGDQLWLFRLRTFSANKFEDNRISLMTDPMYESRRKGAGEFGGYINNYEQMRIDPKTFKLTGGGQLLFTQKELFAPADKLGIQSGGGAGQ